MCIFVVLYLYIIPTCLYHLFLLYSVFSLVRDALHEQQPPPLHARNTILNWRLLHMHCGALSFRTPLVFWRSLVHAAMFLPRACNKSLQENTSLFCKASCGLISATKELCLVGTSTTFCNVEHVICVAMPELCCLVSIQFPQTWWETMRNECWGIGLTEHVDLSRKVCLRVGLLKHAKRSNLARHRTIGWLRVADVSLMHLSRHSNAMPESIASSPLSRLCRRPVKWTPRKTRTWNSSALVETPSQKRWSHVTYPAPHLCHLSARESHALPWPSAQRHWIWKASTKTHSHTWCGWVPCYGSASILTWWHYLQISRSKSEQVSQKSCYRIHFTIHFLTQCTWPHLLWSLQHVSTFTVRNVHPCQRNALPAETLASVGKLICSSCLWNFNISIHFLWSSIAGIWYPFGLLINRMIL